MTLHAGFAQTDITPRVFPARTYWSTVETAMDPLYANAAVFDNGTSQAAFLSLDVVIVERKYVELIRRKAAELCDISPEAIMIHATHNHACPAVVDRPWSPKDEPYLAFMVNQGARAIAEAYRARVPVETGCGRGVESRIAFNRRFVLKNGTVVTQPSFDIVSRDVLYGESVIDPEVGVLSVRDRNQNIIGVLVNFACHAVHHMGRLSAGYPGVMRERLMREYGDHSVCVFLNGACGNVHHHNFAIPDGGIPMETTGQVLAEDVIRIVKKIDYHHTPVLQVESKRVDIRYREIQGLADNLGTLRRFNVFEGLITRDWYPWSLEKLKAMHARQDHETAEIQALRIGEVVFTAIPAEYFCQHSLRIKEESPVPRTFVVSLANGWLGYIPDIPGSRRIGGHETTWCISSKMEPLAGDQMADAALALIRSMHMDT